MVTSILDAIKEIIVEIAKTTRQIVKARMVKRQLEAKERARKQLEEALRRAGIAKASGDATEEKTRLRRDNEHGEEYHGGVGRSGQRGQRPKR